jgi:hypothetical protein
MGGFIISILNDIIIQDAVGKIHHAFEDFPHMGGNIRGIGAGIAEKFIFHGILIASVSGISYQKNGTEGDNAKNNNGFCPDGCSSI